jgi:23S rRNA-/tRNA-specific pseudouridylate synthase
VQFAHRNHPLLGDTKYGDERFNNEIALCATFLSVDGHEYSIEPSWQF